MSRRRAQRLIADGAVTLNGRVARARDKGRLVGADDRVGVSPDAGRVVPEPRAPLVELAAGPGWVAVDKPAGVAVHPLREAETGAVLNAVAGRYPHIQGVGASGGEGGLGSGVVHRLDVQTSGVLLFALDEARWRAFRRAFAERQTAKTYLAVVDGTPDAEGRVELDLKVARHRPAKVVAAAPGDPDARRCDLSWRLAQRRGGRSLLEIELGTGFLHQIRATLAHLGHPVCGDRVYADAETAAAAPRLMLHAHRLGVLDIDVTSPTPRGFDPAGGQ